MMAAPSGLLHRQSESKKVLFRQFVLNRCDDPDYLDLRRIVVRRFYGKKPLGRRLDHTDFAI